MSAISNRLQEIMATIQAYQAKSSYQQAVQLLAVSKAQSVEAIRAAFIAGQTAFGENYLQEALSKQQALQDLAIEWHFIGPIQSNKTQPIAQHFAWVHGVDRVKIAQRLNDARPAHMPALQVCIQLNVSFEATKSGVTPDEVSTLAHAIQALPRLKLRGLMTIPSPTTDANKLAAEFKAVRQCYDALIAAGVDIDTLSMGMSQDYPLAIAHGATIVRIGSALFGARA